MKRKISSAICLLLVAACLLPSCKSITDNAGIDSTDTSTVTDDSQAQVYPEESVDPDSISYEDEEIPSVYITTENNFQVTSKTVYTQCNVRIENNDRYSVYTSNYTDSDGGSALIRCRGNMSYNIADMKEKLKYSYKIKLDEKADVLGMGESRHWVLINSWRDPSYQRNKAAYDYSAMMGLTHVDSQWVNVYYNGQYRGAYLLAESIRVAEDRLEIFSWEDFAEDMAENYASDHGFSQEKTLALSTQMEENLSWITTQKFSFKYSSSTLSVDLSGYYDVDDLDLTSGYLIESCQGAMGSETVNWYTEHKVPISVDSPSRLTNEYMLNYVRTLIKDFEDALFSPTFYNDKGKHYSEYVDVDSMVDYWLVWNFFLNNEFSNRSLFFYIENGKIVWGPCWDFDQTMGSVMTVPEKWAEPNYWLEDRNNAWWLEIFGDPWFTSRCQERWYELRELNDVFLQTFDIYYAYIAEEAQRGYEFDGVRYLRVNRPNVNNGHSFTPAEDYVFMKDWLKKRLNWLDTNFAKIDANIDASGNTRSEKIYTSVSYDGVDLEKDKQTVYGVCADYMLNSNATGKIRLRISTTHSTVAKVDVYLNGSTKLGQKAMSSSTEAIYEVDVSKLDMSNGALNVFYIIAYRSAGTVRSISSVYIRVSDLPNPENDECVVKFGDTVMIVKKGSEITVPDYPYIREGYAYCGWTTSLWSNTVYKPGETFKVTRNISFYIRFKPMDMCSEFVIDEYIVKES